MYVKFVFIRFQNKKYVHAKYTGIYINIQLCMINSSHGRLILSLKR